MSKKSALSLSILLSLILSLIISSVSGAAEVQRMTDKLIRLHVIANSNSEYDQSLKLEVRDKVLETVSRLTAGASSKAEAEEIICDNISSIEAAADEILKDAGQSVKCSYGSVHIDKRIYDNFTLPAGIYDALCVRIGKAEGNNWWCVLYPSLCVSCAVSEDSFEFDDGELKIIKQPEKVKYKLFCFEVFQRIKSALEDLPKLRIKT